MKIDLLILLNVIAAVVGGVLAIPALIISKRPDARAMIDKLTPFQALIGVAMLALSLINFLRMVPHLNLIFKANLFGTAATFTMYIASALLGILFGMPQITKWIPGNSSAEQKALQLTQRIAPFQVLLGLVTIASALIVLLYQLGILKYAG